MAVPTVVLYYSNDSICCDVKYGKANTMKPVQPSANSKIIRQTIFIDIYELNCEFVFVLDFESKT